MLRTGNSGGLAFVTCIERGFLEEQSLLLYESIRRFGGPYSDAAIYAYCPRTGHSVEPATVAAMEALEVSYIDEPLNREVDYFAYANKNFAAAHAEQHTRHETIVFLDSDTMFFRGPEMFELPDDVDVRARAVDLKGISSSGPDDPATGYWRELAAVCRTDLDALPMIRTSVDKVPIHATYNGGLVVARRKAGVFARWAENMLAVHRAGLRPRPHSFWGTGQSTLAMAIHGMTSRVDLLPHGYNYPLHLHDTIHPDERIRSTSDLVHLHYHWMFEREYWPKSALARPEFAWEPAVREWLLAKLPLTVPRPANDDGVRAVKSSTAG